MSFIASYIFDIFLIGFAIVSTVFCLIRGKSVIYECKSGARFIIPVIFFICGLLAYIRYFDLVSLICFVVLVITGAIFSIVPNGFAHDAFIILGMRYPYRDCEDITVSKTEKRIEISFKCKRKTCFLFEDLDKEATIKDMVKKVRSDRRL